MARRTLFRGATCVLPDATLRADVLVEGERIAVVDAPAGTRADETIDAAGLHLIPGAIDDQVHFREPGLEHKEDLRTGSIACAAGGITTFLEMPNTKPAATTRARIAEKYDRAARSCVVDHGFYIGATSENLDELLAVEGVPGIKIFIGSSTGDLLVDEQAALERIFASGTLPITAHCEDETTVRANAARLAGGRDVTDHSRIRTVEAAAISVRRAMELARRHRRRFHVLHVSTRAEVELLADHGDLVTAEACPHHLFFTTEDYPRLGTRIQMNPSVKSPDDRAALWEALADGRLQVIATDHAPHTLEEKALPWPQSPSGLPAVENVLALMLDAVNAGRCTLEQVVGWMCDAPARTWDVVGKGRIAEGYDADLVLVDLERTRTIRDAEQLTKCRWSPWDGTMLRGWPVATWVRGRCVFRDGRVDASSRGAPARYDHARGGYWATA